MILVTPDQWRDSNNQPTINKPISLLSGNRLSVLSSVTSVYALQRAGMPSATVTVADYVRLMYQNPGPGGVPTHSIPSSYNQYIP